MIGPMPVTPSWADGFEVIHSLFGGMRLNTEGISRFEGHRVPQGRGESLMQCLETGDGNTEGNNEVPPTKPSHDIQSKD